MNHNVNSIVIIIKNCISAHVMNEVDIKTSIKIFFRTSYDKEKSTMEKINDTLSMKKFDTLMNNLHTARCVHLIKDKDKILIFLEHIINQIMQRC